MQNETAKAILSLYLIVLGLHLFVELALILLNLKSIRKNALEVPDMFKSQIDPAEYQKGVCYNIAKGRFAVFDLLYSSVVLLSFVLLGWFGYIDRSLAAWHLGTYVQGVLYILLVSFVFSLMGIPLDLYSVFVIEERFGFNKTTCKLWLADLLKGWLVGAAVVTPLLCGLFWFMDRSGAYWWVYAFLFVLLFQLLVVFVYPIWIAPLFNKFTPLADGELKQRILALAAQTGFKAAGIFIMDGSRRSAHSNAYFTGFGRQRRVVLFDTLIELLAPPGLLAVLAHEIGHALKRHVIKMLLLSAAVMLAGFWALSRMLNYTPFFNAFGFERCSYHAALIIFGFAFDPVLYFLSPLLSALSRRFEYDADRFAVRLTGGFQHLSQALLTLSKKNLSNLSPHPWYSFVHYSHPTLPERLEAMRRYWEQESRRRDPESDHAAQVS